MKFRFIKEEKGAAIILLALALVILIGLAAVTIDIGMVSIQKGDLQAAADAAALAGVQDLPNASTAKSTAIYYAGLNGVQSSETKPTTPYNGDVNKLEVVCTRTVTYSFARVLGLTQSVISARAVAKKEITGGGSVGGDYVLFSNSATQGVTFYGGGTNIKGNIHTNNKFDFKGNMLTIDGRAEAVMGLNGINANVKLTNPIPNAPPVVMKEFPLPAAVPPSPTGVTWTTTNPGWQGGGDYVISTPIYFNGNFSADCGGKVRITGNGCVIATGSISMGGTVIDTNNSVALRSLNSTVSFSETTEMTGGSGSIIAYGDITFVGSPFTIKTANKVAVRSVNGNIKCGATLTLLGNGCMVAEKNIELRGGTVNVETTTHPDMYSINGNVEFTNSNNVKGVIYAPKGTISLSGGQFIIKGSFIANYISIGHMIIGELGGGGATTEKIALTE